MNENQTGVSEKPTKVRRWVLVVVCLVYLITYLDRVNISVAAPLMMKDFNLNKLEWGLVLSVFSWTYASFQIPIGMLSDRLGARPVLAGIVTLWSIMTAATALAWNFSSLLVIRMLFGVGEAGAFPTATRAFSHWIPAVERGFAQGLTHGFARFGGAVTPLIVAVMMAQWGWRFVFYSFAIIGVVWSVGWYYWYRDKPSDYQARWGGVNQAEIDLINSGKSDKPKPKLPFKTLMKSPNMWYLCLSYPTYCYVIWIFMTWMPAYLVEARGFGIIKMGIFASLPLLAGTVGDTLGGWLSDKIWARTGRGKFSRRIVAMTGMFVAAAFMIPGALTDSGYMAVFYLACSLFGLEMAVGVYWAVCLDVGHEYAGTVSGMMNSIGNIGSAASPLVFGAILEYTGSWVYPFLVASALLVIGALLWLKVDPELSVVDELGLTVDEEPVGPAV
ncbi:MAG: MFS transporter [Negativicutes bacterium]|nr:MFS transporter [Negativicutes bacterium]